MTPDELLLTRRSVRRYSQDPVPADVLRQIVNVARYAPSGGNAQRWDVVLVHDPQLVARVFPTLGWLKPIDAPPEGRRPTAYAVVISAGDPRPADCAGLVSYILLAAHARGVGTCWFGSVRAAELAAVLGLPDGCRITFVVSMGYPDERIEPYDSDEATAVTIEDGVVRVPKRTLNSVMHENGW